MSIWRTPSSTLHATTFGCIEKNYEQEYKDTMKTIITTMSSLGKTFTTSMKQPQRCKLSWRQVMLAWKGAFWTFKISSSTTTTVIDTTQDLHVLRARSQCMITPSPHAPTLGEENRTTTRGNMNAINMKIEKTPMRANTIMSAR